MDKMLRRPSGGVWRNDHALLVFLIIVLFLPRGSRPICSQSSQSKAVANNVHKKTYLLETLLKASSAVSTSRQKLSLKSIGLSHQKLPFFL